MLTARRSAPLQRVSGKWETRRHAPHCGVPVQPGVVVDKVHAAHDALVPPLHGGDNGESDVNGLGGSAGWVRHSVGYSADGGDFGVGDGLLGVDDEEGPVAGPLHARPVAENQVDKEAGTNEGGVQRAEVGVGVVAVPVQRVLLSERVAGHSGAHPVLE